MKIPEIDRRTFIQMTAATGTMSAIPYAEAAPPETGIINQSVSLRVNGKVHKIEVDTRATLLDTLREQLQLFGTRRAAIMASAVLALSTLTVGDSTPSSR